MLPPNDLVIHFLLLPAQVHYDKKEVNCNRLILSIFKIFVNTIQYTVEIVPCYTSLSIFNINWRDVQTKNVVNNVDMSC